MTSARPVAVRQGWGNNGGFGEVDVIISSVRTLSLSQQPHTFALPFATLDG